MRGSLLVGSSPLGFIPHILREIRGKRILDVGCGCGVYGYLLRNKWQDTPPGYDQFKDFSNRDVSNDEPEFLGGIDVQTESVRRCAKHRIYDFLALARADDLPFPDDYVDTILCIEVLEHLTKPEALKALESFERIATQRIIVTVPIHSLSPNGHDERDFLKLDTSDPEIKEFVDAETHKSCWTATHLRQLGFRIGREIRQGRKAPYDIVVNFWQQRRLGQVLAVKELGDRSAKSSSVIRAPAKFTEGIPDYRLNDCNRRET